VPEATTDPGADEAIDPAQLGLAPDAPLPFEFRAGARPSPLVISFPHVGLAWPGELGPRPQVNFRRNADYAVDRLYVRAEALGAATIRARYSRLVVDLNRAEDDVSPDLVPDHPAPRPRPSTSTVALAGATRRRPIRNRGVVWRHAIGNIPLLSTLDHASFAGRIAAFHRPYYAALAELLERRRRRFGYAVLLDAHSMPGTITGDLVLGTRDGASCAPTLIDAATRALSGPSPRAADRIRQWPLDLTVDDPYRGGEIIAHFGRPRADVHALQLEVNRGLYMDEYRLELGGIPSAERIAAGDHLEPRDRAQRRLAALLEAVDQLVIELSRPREDETLRAAAE